MTCIVSNEIDSFLDSEALDQAIEQAKNDSIDEMVVELMNGEDSSREINDVEYKVTQEVFIDEFIDQWGETELPSLLVRFAKGDELGSNSNRLERIMRDTAESVVKLELGL